MDESILWWENITGPRMLLGEIARTLSNGVSVVLRMSGRQMWQHQIPDLVRHQLSEIPFHYLVWEGDRQEDVAMWLLRSICPARAGMCPGGVRNQMAYLRRERILSGSVVWAEGQGDPAPLLRFLADYRGNSLEQDGVFVVEIPSWMVLPRMNDRIREIRMEDYIRDSDGMLFASLLADGADQIPEPMRPYAATVSAGLAGGNVTLIPALLNMVNFRTMDPATAAWGIWDEVLEGPELPGLEEMEHRVWQAQLQTAFPKMEIERLAICGRYAQEIEKALDTRYFNPKWGESGYVRKRQGGIGNASDVELGTLTWMLSLRRNDNRMEHLLRFPEPGLWDRVAFLTRCRNSMAHHRCCTAEEMFRLLCPEEARAAMQMQAEVAG